MPSASITAASTRLAPQRALGVGLGLGDQLLLGLAGHLEVLRRVEALLAAGGARSWCHISWALAWTSSCGTSIVGLGGGGVDRGLAELAVDRRAPAARAAALRDVLAQLVERVVAAGLHGEVVVERRAGASP